MSASTALERAAGAAETLSERLAATGGPAAGLAGLLEQDAAFMRRLRARYGGNGRAPEPSGRVPQARSPRRRPERGRASERSPWLILGVAFAVGFALARLVSWRSDVAQRL
jgi:hypothetical protein